VGVLARTAEDAAHVLAALAGHDPADPHSVRAPAADYRRALGRGVKGVRIGVPRAYFFDALEPGVARAVDAALDGLRRQGASLHDVTLPVAAPLYDAMFAPIAVSEIRRTYAGEWAARPDAFSPEFAEVFAGPGPSEADVARAHAARARFEQTVAARLSEVDVLAMPTVPLVAPPIAGPIDAVRLLRNTWAFNAARVPAISVPCGTGDAGLPVGLQLVGRMFGEADLLGVAAVVERVRQPSPADAAPRGRAGHGRTIARMIFPGRSRERA
jgi:aspartyl-tRNA(Asn)/glutamyl-tRNA(Gln) amidotransferase subunit A